MKKNLLPQDLYDTCIRIAERVREAGGRALLVGGCVRDALLGLESKDVDIEVFGLPHAELERQLALDFTINHVGKSFGVLKIKDFPIDVALPRRESKVGSGHKGFIVASEPEMSFAEAALRRDFSLNAISWDPLSGEIIDPCNGRRDLTAGVLRHTSEKFIEDPLRVLRAMQFVARFALDVDPSTLALCRQLEPEGLPPERLFEEWKKLLIKGQKPSMGLNFLRDCGWVRYYPELQALENCPQDPEWHPEGDVWIHTLLCLDAYVQERIRDEWEDSVVGFAVLCHDLGKPLTTFCDKDGRIRSPGHAEEGLIPARSFLARLTQQRELIDSVLVLVLHHMRPIELYKARASDAAIRRLSQKVGRIDRLVRVDSADRRGRLPVKTDASPQGQWLLERAEALAVKDAAPQPLVQGRHLIDLGQSPGPSFKPLLQQCYEAQLDGQFCDLEHGLKFVQKLLKSSSSN